MRSISGKLCCFPERGGHSISNVLLEKRGRSKSASTAKAWTIFPLFCLSGVSSSNGPFATSPGFLVEFPFGAGEQIFGFDISLGN